mmetsp:Transcript_102667/g.306626  ORF Transcript_102667/g.306626 Transcript_102667/m.306626 type:complete len:218 (-) Transcript_102667:501-1154(-)
MANPALVVKTASQRAVSTARLRRSKSSSKEPEWPRRVSISCARLLMSFSTVMVPRMIVDPIRRIATLNITMSKRMAANQPLSIVKFNTSMLERMRLIKNSHVTRPMRCRMLGGAMTVLEQTATAATLIVTWISGGATKRSIKCCRQRGCEQRFQMDQKTNKIQKLQVGKRSRYPRLRMPKKRWPENATTSVTNKSRLADGTQERSLLHSPRTTGPKR